MLAKDIMTKKVITVSPDATLNDAAELMTKNNISGLPVVENDMTLVGIISESDIIEDRSLFSGLDHWISIESFLKSNQKPGYEDDPNEDLGLDMNSPVKDYMSTRLITSEPHSTVDEIGRKLVRNRVNRIPIVEDRKIVGIITRGDILIAIKKKL